ncbi:MAG: hypothetical protein KGY41_07500, partial [Desulfovermiculus sp.]|nr:hypothetical protein [Desulfovermiculus sp.]
MDIFMAKQMRVVCRLVLIQMLLLTISFPGFAEETESHFKVLEIKEQMYAGSPAVAVLLSQALDPTIRHDRHLRISDVRKMLKSVWVLSEDGHTLYYPHVKPESEYSVTVLPSLKSAQDQELGTRVSEVVKTRKMPAGVSFASNGFVLPSKLSDGLPVVTVNVEEVFIEFFRLHDQGLIDFVNWSSLSGKKSAYRLRQLGSKYGDLVYSGRFDLHAPDNRRVIRNIGVQDIDALSQPGVYVAVLRQPGQYEYQYSCAYFLVTDIGLQVRVYADEIMVIASSIKTGKPLQGVELSFVDKESRVVLKGTTDSQGLFAYTGTNIDSFRVLKVIASSQVGVLPLQTSALDLSGFDITGRDFQPREVFLYSPRDLYRPGEQMIISALFRDYDGRPLPDLPLHVSLIRPDNKELRSFSWHPRELNATGINYYQKTIHIPSTAQTGKWRVEVKGDPAASVSVGSYSFHVEEFVPERMKLQLTSPKDLLHGKGPWPIEARGTYLYGAPADNNEIETRIFVRASRHPFPDLKDFEFGLEEEKHYSDTWKKNAKHLDKQGKADLSIENHWTNLKSPMAVHATVSLLESGGRPVKRTITRTFFPANELVGIRKLFEQDTLGPGPVGFEVVNVDRQGNFIPAENLVLDIIKQDREYFWEYSEEKGWTREYTEKNSVLRSETVQFDGQKPLNYTVRLERGRYLLRVKNLSTGQMTTTRFRVGFWWGGADETDGAHPEKVMLQLDQPAYQPGDRIELTVTPPHSGQALITVESDTTLWSRRTHVSDQGTVLEIPVSADWNRHDMYISAVVFRPCNAPEKIGPNRAVGVIHLPLQRSRRKLEVNIDAPDKVSPQDTLPVHIQVKGQGQKAFVTLAAVDVGVLNITDMKTPQPYAWFFTPRRYDVLWYDMYGKIIEMMEGEAATVTFGGDKDMRPGGKRPETKVEIVSLFKGPVELSEQGEARIDLHLPYFNGRLRLMAVAFSKNDYGSAHGQVQVTAPLVTQLSTPRFLAAGDSSQLTLDIHNLSGRERMIEL